MTQPPLARRRRRARRAPAAAHARLGPLEPQDARPVRRRPGVFEEREAPAGAPLRARRSTSAPARRRRPAPVRRRGARSALLAQPRPRLADDPTTALACVGASPPARARRAAPPPPRPAPLLLLVSAAEGSGALEGVTLETGRRRLADLLGPELRLACDTLGYGFVPVQRTAATGTRRLRRRRALSALAQQRFEPATERWSRWPTRRRSSAAARRSPWALCGALCAPRLRPTPTSAAATSLSCSPAWAWDPARALLPPHPCDRSRRGERKGFGAFVARPR